MYNNGINLFLGEEFQYGQNGFIWFFRDHSNFIVFSDSWLWHLFHCKNVKVYE